jgi:hypothetical protein
MGITTHTDFYNAWMENPKTIDRVNLLMEILDIGTNTRESFRFDKDGNKSDKIHPEVEKLLRLIKKNINIEFTTTGIVDYDKVIGEYTQWFREQNLEKLCL